jgi:hypothetical protein
MNEELLSILGHARRRLAAARAVETAGAAIVAGAFSAAGGELAWALAARSRIAGLAIVAALLAATLAWAAWMSRRLARGDKNASGSCRLLACVAIAVAGFAAIGILTGLHLRWPKAILLAAGACAALSAGAGTLAARPGLRRVAAILDAKGRLRERVSTAVELISSAAPPASAAVVYAQALAALKDRRPQDAPFWSAPPALPAAAGLALAVSLAMAFVPDFAPTARGGAAALARALPSLTPAQRDELAAALRRAACEPAAGRSADDLRKAAAFVDVQDAAELQRMFEKLKAQGYEPLAAVPREMLAAAGAVGEFPATLSASSGHPIGKAPPDGNEPADGGGYVSVYDPLYESRQADDGNALPAVAAHPPPAIPYADAWAAACARAADSAARSAVPPAYRALVRDFFTAGE